MNGSHLTSIRNLIRKVFVRGAMAEKNINIAGSVLPELNFAATATMLNA